MNDDEPDRVDEVLREHGQAWANAFVEPKRRDVSISVARIVTAGRGCARLGRPPRCSASPRPLWWSWSSSGKARRHRLPTPAPVINSRRQHDRVRAHRGRGAAVEPGEVGTAADGRPNCRRCPRRSSAAAATLCADTDGRPLLEVIRDTSDPTRLWVTPNTFGPTGGGTQCSPLMQFTVTVQDAERVEIVAAAYAMDAGAAVTCTDIGQSPVQVAIPLAAPLGDRRVVDGSNAQVMTVLDPDQFPEPAYLPNGFESRGSAGIETDHGRIARTYWKGEERLEIAWSEGTFELSDVSEAISHPDVHGVTATVWKDKGFDDARLITWGAAPGWYVTIQSNAAEHQTLSAAELLKVARSMPIPDPPSPAAGDTSTSSTG